MEDSKTQLKANVYSIFEMNSSGNSAQCFRDSNLHNNSEQGDKLYRRIKAGRYFYETELGDTATISKRYTSTINTLRQALEGAFRRIDFSSYYTAYLLDQLSDDEFEEIALKFQYTPDEDVDLDEISEKIEILISCISRELTPSDIAEIFTTSEAKVHEALDKIADNRLFQI